MENSPETTEEEPGQVKGRRISATQIGYIAIALAVLFILLSIVLYWVNRDHAPNDSVGYVRISAASEDLRVVGFTIQDEGKTMQADFTALKTTERDELRGHSLIITCTVDNKQHRAKALIPADANDSRFDLKFASAIRLNNKDDAFACSGNIPNVEGLDSKRIVSAVRSIVIPGKI